MLNDKLIDIYRQIAYDECKKPADRVKACKSLYKHCPDEKDAISSVLEEICSVEEVADAVKILALDLLDSITNVTIEEHTKESVESIESKLLEKYLG